MSTGTVHAHYEEIEAYVTKDGSVIGELMHPNVHGNSNVSFAEAAVTAGKTTLLHKHHESEEIYHISAGSAMMELAGKQFAVHTGDTVCISPGVEHRITNSGSEELKFFGVASPPYQHTDTEVTETHS